ncbi:thioredoxin family protein [soil metagenome]
MNRRGFLRAVGLAGAAGLLTACGGGAGAGSDPTTDGGSSTKAQADDIIVAVAPDAAQTLSVVDASFEQLTGTGQPFAFGLVGQDNQPVRNADVRVHVLPTGSEITGPYAAEFRDVPRVALGLYVVRIDLTEAVPTAIVIVTADGAQAGLTGVNVVTPADSALPAPGDHAIVTPTPTRADPMGLRNLCTREPDCGMHDVSLAQALADRRPVMLTFATPAYCETAVCGPSVDVLEQVRTARNWGDVAFVHVEIFSDAGKSVARPVHKWGLPSEPWLFAIAGDGTITDRADGPLLILPDQVAAMASQLA